MTITRMKRQDSAISDICHRGHRLYLILWRKLLFCGEWPSNGRIERSHLVWFGGVWIGEEEIITVQRDLNNITSFLGCCSMTIMIYKGPTTYQIITFVGPPLKLHLVKVLLNCYETQVAILDLKYYCLETKTKIIIIVDDDDDDDNDDYDLKLRPSQCLQTPIPPSSI